MRWFWIGSLFLFMAFCFWGFVRDSIELRQFEVETLRLEKLVGRIDTNDEEKIHLVNTRNEGPSEFVWRVHLPAGHAWTLSHKIAAGGGGSNTRGVQQQPQDFLLRVRLVRHDGQWALFVLHASGSATNGLSEHLGRFLSEHWNEFDVGIAADKRQASYSTDEVVSLLSIKVPESLRLTAKDELGMYTYKQLQTQPLFMIELGTESAFVARKKSLEAGSQ